MQVNPKVLGALGGAAAGVGIAAGVLQGLGIDAGAVAKDVATVVMQGVIGCPADPTPVCAAGGRLVEVAALAAIASAGAWLGHLLSPAKADPPPAA